MADRHLLVTFMVTEDGEQGHPMGHIVTRVDLNADGEPDDHSITRLTDRIRREIRRKGGSDAAQS